MALFRRKAPVVVRKGDATEREERKTVKVGRSTVEVRKVSEAPPPPAQKQKAPKKGIGKYMVTVSGMT